MLLVAALAATQEESTMARLRLGVIGAGSWTVSSHLPNLVRRRDAGEVEFTIVNRRNPALLDRIKDDFGFEQATDDWHEVIAAKPDIVVVGSPPGHHFAQAKAALEAGAHVMCEKPFTIDPADAWELDQTVKRTGRQLFVSYGWNYRPMVIQAHRIMHDDGIGDIEQVSLHMDSVTRELLSETGDYPGRRPGHRAPGGYLVATRDERWWLRPGAADAPAGCRVVAHRPARPGRVRAHDGAHGRPGGAPRCGRDAFHQWRHRHHERRLGPPRGSGQSARGRGPCGRLEGPVPARPAREHPVALPAGDDLRVPLEPDAGLYDCRGPIDAVVDAGLGRSPANNSPAELGARTVEILHAAYRSAASGVLERVSTLDRQPA